MSLNHLTRYRSRWSFFSELVKPGDTEESDPIEFAAPETFEHDLEQADRQQVVEKALQRLPPAQRVPLVLFHLHGLSYEQIAAKLNVSLGKVKTDIFRARESMRKRLRTQLDEIRPA
jgi:RNA polymerase sigma-70 factor (ECF subfamily)